MVKKRSSIPKAISEPVLKEYRHRCAICGRHEPQLHHIDEDPSNNDPLNLLPICPNCHLQDIHAPTAALDPKKIKLFRRCKDPFILDPRFHPLWKRLQFLRADNYERKEGTYSWNYLCSDLTTFVSALSMGSYYSAKIKSILKEYLGHMVAHKISLGDAITKQEIMGDSERHREAYEFRATAIEDLCVEMLRYQGWHQINAHLNKII